MSKFILFDEAGVLLARYDSQVNGENIPAAAVEVDDDVFCATINESNGIWMRDSESGAVEKHPFPPPSHEQLKAIAGNERDRLFALAAMKIAPLQDAADLSIATDAEKKLLAGWKAYRVQLLRVEQQPGYPAAIEWPHVPL